MNYKFLIYISYNYSIPIGKPLQEEIEKRGYTVKWFSDIQKTNTYFTNKESVIYTIKDVIYYKPDIVLCATNLVPDFITGIKVQVFHGFNAEKRPSKKNLFSHFKIRGFFDLYCTQGPNTTSVFKNLEKKYGYFNVVETGWSKMDPLFPIEPLIEKKIPTVLIASTFTPRLSLAHNEEVFNEIKRLVSAKKYNFSMVLHPKMDSKIVMKWKKLNSAWFTFYNTTDLIPLFKQADILFADNTSAIQEFLLQKRIVISFKHTFKHNYLLHSDNAKNIEENFKKALESPKEIIENIKTFILELHPYVDGKSSERVIDSSISFLHKDKRFLKSKPLNLIRKYKIRRKLNYFTFKSFGKPYTLKIEPTNNNPKKNSTILGTTVKLSAVVTTHNEEMHIEKCLNSLVDVADEIIVVDSFSTDNTEAICEKFNVTFIQHEFKGYCEQKNVAISQASHEYILSLDGNEALSEQLKGSVLAIKQDWKFDGYFTKKITNYCGSWIKHSDLNPTVKPFLFKKEIKEWKAINLYNGNLLKKYNRIEKLDGVLLHWVYEDYTKLRTNIDAYTTHTSETFFNSGIKSSFFKIIYKPTWSFFRSYFLKLEIKNGISGFILSTLNAYSVFSNYVKVYLLQKGIK